eukprot:8966943-Alexandrium_andersonii.AAC.1
MSWCATDPRTGSQRVDPPRVIRSELKTPSLAAPARSDDSNAIAAFCWSPCILRRPAFQSSVIHKQSASIIHTL